MKIGKVLLIMLGVILLGVIIYLIATQKDEPYKSVELSNRNFIMNNTEYKFIDTVLDVGLEAVGLKELTININPLSDAAKSSFDGTLKAHIRYYGGIYYVFVDAVSHKEAMTVFAHEIVHINQYENGSLVYDGSGTIVEYLGERYDVQIVSYESRPWEIDAFRDEKGIELKIAEKLY